MTGRKFSRKYLRIKPDFPVYADLRIQRIGQKTVSTSAARLRVADISPGGIKFYTHLDLPVGEDIIYSLVVHVKTHDFNVNGRIVRKAQIQNNLIEYGFCFSEPNYQLRSCLRSILKYSSVSVEKHVLIMRVERGQS